LETDTRPIVLKSKVLASSWRIDYFEDTLQSGVSPPFKYTWYRTPNVAVVIASKRGQVPLVRQYRHGSKRELWELPGGLIEEGESPIQAAKRELAEEVGVQLHNPKLIATINTVPSRSDQRAYVVAGGVGKRVAGTVGESEPLTAKFVGIRQAGKLLSRDISAVHYLAFLIWLRRRRQTLKGLSR
jgi:8-oxo-dGTP pyrophosphatase MutT (NUDIX family)